MTNVTTPPPPAPPEPPQPSDPGSQPASSTTQAGTKALAITLGVIGGGVLLLGGIAAAFAAVASSMFSAAGGNGFDSLSVDGVSSVRIDSSAGDVLVEYGDVSDAQLSWESDGGDWRFTQDGDELVVQSPRFDFSLFDWSHEQSAVLTLPERLEGADLAIDISAGELRAEGAFGQVTYELSAGQIEIEGSAETLDAQMSAGSSIIELADVREASFDVSAGDLYGRLSGEPPQSVTIDLSAGKVDLQLPDVPYNVNTEGFAGDVTSSLKDDPGAPRTVDVSTAAGDVTLYAN